jgi:hypothetical protein
VGARIGRRTAGRDRARGPRWLHTPYYVRPEDYWPDGDPFVLGDRFLYTRCKQFKGDRPTFLRDLATASLILFGSRVGGEFVLDTVLVVADGTLYDSGDWRGTPAGRTSERSRSGGCSASSPPGAPTPSGPASPAP